MSAGAEGARKAMKGFGTDEKGLCAALCKVGPLEIIKLKQQYNSRFMRDLQKDIEKETSGIFEKALVAVLQGPLDHDCHVLYDAMKGVGTKEDAVDDVLCNRSNADINAIKQQYQKLFHASLESHIQSDLSGNIAAIYKIILSSQRQEDAAPVIPHQISDDVQKIHGGVHSPVTIAQIIVTRNDNQLKAIASEFERTYVTPLVKFLKDKLSGHTEDALILFVDRALDRPKAEAVRLEETMKGMGTKDQLLIDRAVRVHWDRNFTRQIRDAYKKVYKTDLIRRIKEETRGDQEIFLVATLE
jgi:annexin A7/11